MCITYVDIAHICVVHYTRVSHNLSIRIKYMALMTLNLGADEELSIQQKRERCKVPPFLPLGAAGKNRHRIQGMDVSNRLKQLSGKSSWFFWSLEQVRNRHTNICVIGRELPLSDSERRRIPRAYKELMTHKLVVRVSRDTYMINPKAIIPNFDDYASVWEDWKSNCDKQGITYE